MTTPATTDPVASHEPIRISTKQAREDVDLVTLFSIDDVDFQIPARPRANLALVQLRLVRELGPDMANVGLLRELLGPVAFNALEQCDEMTSAQLEGIALAAMRLTMGPLEAISGN